MISCLGWVVHSWLFDCLAETTDRWNPTEPIAIEQRGGEIARDFAARILLSSAAMPKPGRIILRVYCYGMGVPGPHSSLYFPVIRINKLVPGYWRKTQPDAPRPYCGTATCLSL